MRPGFAKPNSVRGFWRKATPPAPLRFMERPLRSPKRDDGNPYYPQIRELRLAVWQRLSVPFKSPTYGRRQHIVMIRRGLTCSISPGRAPCSTYLCSKRTSLSGKSLSTAKRFDHSPTSKSHYLRISPPRPS